METRNSHFFFSPCQWSLLCLFVELSVLSVYLHSWLSFTLCFHIAQLVWLNLDYLTRRPTLSGQLQIFENIPEIVETYYVADPDLSGSPRVNTSTINVGLVWLTYVTVGRDFTYCTHRVPSAVFPHVWNLHIFKSFQLCWQPLSALHGKDLVLRYLESWHRSMYAQSYKSCEIIITEFSLKL